MATIRVVGATITTLGRASIAPLTKFRVPRERGDTVERRRLLAALQASVANNPLTLVVAPGGSGKTTALVQLAAALRQAQAVVWVSVDREDDDPNRLFAALVDAFGPLQLAWEVDPRGLLAGVDEDGARRRAAVAALVNALCTAGDTRIALIVDDLHRLESPGVAQLLEALLERLPTHVAVVIGTRTLPDLPLQRWRAHGEIGEIALDALRFDEPEALALARAKHPSASTMPDVAAIRSAVARTRGWAVGLSMLLQTAGAGVDTAGTVAGASADGLPAAHRGSAANPRLFGYLASEILAKLPAPMQRFVTRCAILDELEPGTCEAVSGDVDAGTKLGTLLRGNLFVTAVDEFVPVLRFHDLFRDFLLAELERREPASIPALHEAAARAERSETRAIHHFLRAGAWDEAIARIARCGDELLRRGAIATVERWLEQIPAQVRAEDPEVAYLHGSCGWLRWDWDRARRGLRAAVRGMVRPEQLPRRIGATFQLVDALASSGERDEARVLLDEVARMPLDARGRAALGLQRAWCEAPEGDTAYVVEQLEIFIRNVERDPARVCPLTAGGVHCMLVGIPGVATRFERFVALADNVSDASAAAAPWQLAKHAIDGWTRLWHGDRIGAEAALARAETLYHQFGGIRLMAERIGQLRGMLLAASGRTAAAQAIAQLHLRGLDAPEVARHRAAWRRAYLHAAARFHWITGELERWREFLPELLQPRRPEEWPFVELAALVARGQAAIADRDWSAAMEALGHATSRYHRQRMPAIYCDPRVSLAWAQLQAGRREAARQSFEPVLAEVIRHRAHGILILDSRPHVDALLADAVPGAMRRSPQVAQLRGVLDSWRTATDGGTAALGAGVAPRLAPVPTGEDAARSGLLQSLSAREREVLERVAAGASNKHIARDLELSLHTVKRHLCNILDKLECDSRGQAADRYRRALSR